MEQLTNYFGQNIKDKRIVITGGTTGIGKAIADLLVSLGGRILIFGRDHEDFKTPLPILNSNFQTVKFMALQPMSAKKMTLQKSWKL